MVTFIEIRNLFPNKLSKETGAELAAIRRKMNSLKTEDEKKAYFEELKLKYAQASKAETTKKEKSAASQKTNTFSSFAELGQFHDDLAEQQHLTTTKEKEVQPRKNKQTKIKKRKSKYSKKDLENLYPSQEALDNAWEYLQHQPDEEKAKFITERKEKVRIQEKLSSSWLETADRNAADFETISKVAMFRIYKISNLSPEEREQAANEFLAQCTSEKDKTMTEEKKEENKTNPKYDEVLNDWAKSKNIDLEKLSDDNKKAAQAYFDKYGNLNDFETQVIVEDNNKQPPVSKDEKDKEANNKEAPVKVKVSESQQKHSPLNDDLGKIKEHWEKWCAETKDEKNQPLRNFKEIPNEDGFLKFEIEPTEALKAKDSNAKGAEVTYYSETEATMPMTDYDYFYQMAKAAKEVSHAEVIECGNIKTPGYATRLIAAAYANGLDVEKAPDKLDLSKETLMGIPDETILMVLDKQIFNRDSNTAEKVDYDSIKDALRVYKDIQERAKDENGNPKGSQESLDISKMHFTDEAAKNKTIAAALEMGLNIKGVDKLNLTEESTKGIPSETLNKMLQDQVYGKKDIEYETVKEAVKLTHDMFKNGEEDKDINISKLNIPEENNSTYNKVVAATLELELIPQETKKLNIDPRDETLPKEAYEALNKFKLQKIKEAKERKNQGNTEENSSSQTRSNNYNNNNYRQKNQRGGYE